MDINGVNSTNYYATLAKKNNHISYDGESLKFDLMTFDEYVREMERRLQRPDNHQ